MNCLPFPIASAPKDGTRILAYGLLGFETETRMWGTVKWEAHYGKWQCDPTEATEYDQEACVLTHWLPLPAPPK